MDENQKQKLDGILWAFTDRKNKAKEESAKRTEERNVHIERFKELSIKTLRPIMQEVWEAIKTQGHDFEIEEGSKEEREHESPYASISMKIYPIGTSRHLRPSDIWAHITFSNSGTPDITTFQSTIYPNGGWWSSGTKNGANYTLDTLSGESAEAEIIDSIDKILNKRY